ncbi:HlyD family efflux transporter periplasmic adaptor subunit [Dorea sp. D27]|uniref:HlyD family efflux transporter periplasmic adaptor subunit n=1 Tax=Dorea sp. D27 TaxID=658665 RepID=UPI0006732663|nr:HlyD family efflux transporter periplasmic adaptor subunit [Dorea sp. D27]KMZ53338.1 putative membrane-fusion protein [Dorea sp. D27]
MENRVKKFSLHVDRKELGRKFKRVRKKKAFWIMAAIMAVLLLAMAAGLIIRAKGKTRQAAEMTVQSATAEKGNISTTVAGTGTLESGATTDVVVPTGIKVKEVLVEPGDTVEEGQMLATLDEASIASELLEVKESKESVQEQIDGLSSDAEESGTMEYLEAKVLYGQMEELEAAEESLDTLLETKAVTASCAGTVDSVNVSADTEIMQSTSSGTGSSSEDAAAADASGTGNESGTSSGGVAMSDTGSKAEIILLSAADTTSGVQSISDCCLTVEAPAAGQKPQSDIKETDEYAGTITWNCATDVFQADTAYTATIKLTAKSGYEFSSNIIPEVKGADVTGEVLKSDSGDSILKIKARFAKTAAPGTDDAKNSGQEGSSASGSATGGLSGGNAGTAGAEAAGASLGDTSGTGSAGAGSAASGGGTSGGDTGTSDSGEYSIYEAAAFTIASGEDMTVSINVDELDILSVEQGQSAAVTLDALDGEEFEGTITNVAQTASSGGSSAKYPVEITLRKTEGMMLGMSASATIRIEESENAVLIPVNALQEQGNSTFVYTGKDEKGKLTDEVEVETGLSNGSQVEIVSGLSEGDTVYYLKAGSTATEGSGGVKGGQDGMMHGADSMPDGGQMPGGEMPDSGSMPQGGPENGVEQ